MFILEHYSYEVYEYDKHTILCVSDTVEKLVAYATTLPQWDEVYDQQWELSSNDVLRIEYITDYFVDSPSVCRAEGFTIRSIQAI